MKTRAHVYVSGIVQGVFFRASMAKRAKALDVTGWARNKVDGRVEAVFEGERSIVEQMIAFCWKGVSKAVVTSVDTSWEEFTGEYMDFRIR